MIGKNQIILNREAVIEALQEYLAKRIVNGDHQIVRDYQEWIMPPVSTPVFSASSVGSTYVSQEPPGLCIAFEHVKHFVTGKA